MGDSFVATGLTIEDNLLSRAAKATKGYAYLVQLVGYSIWQRANLHRAKSAIVSGATSPKALRWQRLVFTMLFTSQRFPDWGLTISNTFWRCARTNNSPNRPRLLGAWVKRPMRSAPLGQNCYKERLFRRHREATCSLPCRT